MSDNLSQTFGLYLLIKARLKGDDSDKTAPIGTVAYGIGDLEDSVWLECDGSLVRKAEFPELYSVLGDQYSPPKVIQSSISIGWVDTVVHSWLGIQRKSVPNPAYNPDYFGLPNTPTDPSKLVKTKV
jgi:hypothetical protein